MCQIHVQVASVRANKASKRESGCPTNEDSGKRKWRKGSKRIEEGFLRVAKHGLERLGLLADEDALVRLPPSHTLQGPATRATNFFRHRKVEGEDEGVANEEENMRREISRVRS